MRWVKHLTRAHADEEIDGILEEFGAEGYGVYWLLIEEIGGRMEGKNPKTSALHSDVKWASIVRTSVRKWRSIAQKMNDRLLISMRSIDNRTEIDIPNILKYKDEYSKKSGQSPDSRTDREQIEKQTTDNNRSSAAPMHPRPEAEEPPPDVVGVVLAGEAEGLGRPGVAMPKLISAHGESLNGGNGRSSHAGKTSEYPLAAERIQTRFPSASDAMVRNIAEQCVRVYSEVPNPQMPPLTDATLAEAISIADGGWKKQESAAGYLSTVPEIIRNWAKRGPNKPVGQADSGSTDYDELKSPFNPNRRAK